MTARRTRKPLLAVLGPSEEPGLPPRAQSVLDQIPPVFGPNHWTENLLLMMAESGATWYFDRR